MTPRLTAVAAAAWLAFPACAAAADVPAGFDEERLQDMTTGQVDAFIREVHGRVPDLRTRVEVFSRAHLGMPYKPGPLGEGPGAAFDADPLTHSVFPAQFVSAYSAMKRAEWDEYHAQVTDCERERYLLAF